MKRKNVFMIILLTVLLAFGCTMPDVTQNKQEETWPLDGITLKKAKQPNVEAFPGTYIRSDDLSLTMEAVSLKEDGTAIGVPYAQLNGLASLKPMRKGTWQATEDTKLFVLKFPDTIYGGEYLPYKSNGKIVGFGFNAPNLHTTEYFYKMSDQTIDANSYNRKSFSGLFAAEDDYGDLFGMEFFENGKMIFYSTDRKTVNYRYKLSPGKPLLKTINESGNEVEYNYILFPSTLILNGAIFQKVR